jgi:hypothetical protein
MKCTPQLKGNFPLKIFIASSRHPMGEERQLSQQHRQQEPLQRQQRHQQKMPHIILTNGQGINEEDEEVCLSDRMASVLPEKLIINICTANVQQMIKTCKQCAFYVEPLHFHSASEKMKLTPFLRHKIVQYSKVTILYSIILRLHLRQEKSIGKSQQLFSLYKLLRQCTQK